jgi:hydroxymethylpyrimidine kinase/phosphomethylpyrimidine kinase
MSPHTAHRPPVALSIAGTDPSGGAGIHADLKTFTARGVYGTTVITGLVAQNTHGVSRVHPVDTDFVSDQFDSVLDDITVDATKTGMLGTRALVRMTVDRAAGGRLGFLTVDPVMVATSGHRLLEADAVSAVRDLLAPVADLLTPNLPEGALLLGDDVPPAADLARQRDQARELVHRGSRAVLLKGGHGLGDVVVDVLAVRAGDDVELREFAHPRIATPHTHGTGCTLSAAITAEVAKAVRAGRDPRHGDTLAEAVVTSLDYLARALRSGATWELSRDPDGAHGPVDHLVDLTGDAR